VLGANDNSLGAIAASSPSDVWAVGNFLPDAAKSNHDATLSFAEHYGGRQWTVVRTPNAGPNFTTLFGVAASQGRAWAVGVRQDGRYADRALIETWDGKKWTIADNPQPGPVRDILFGASALSPSDVWAVGEAEGGRGVFRTLVEHWDGRTWTVVPAPNPGPAGNQFYAVDAVSPDDVWAAGQQLTGRAPDEGLVEHWDGRSWSVVPLPSASASVLLSGIAATADGQVYVAGEADSPAGGGRPLIEYYAGGTWQTASVPAPGGVGLDQPVGRRGGARRHRMGGRQLRGPEDRQQRRADPARHRRLLDRRRRSRARLGEPHPRRGHRDRRAAVGGGHLR
jgi:hypothetical protein